jgi:hypothetical protein
VRASTGRWVGKPVQKTTTPPAAQSSTGPGVGAGSVALPAPPRPSPRSTGPLPSCIFCDRPSGTIEYAWPEWLCRALTDQMAMAGRDGISDPEILARVRREVDQTVRSVCDTCSQGWMQRLEDNVSPFLESMIAGEVTPLPPVRRRVLARWAAKTAVVMECAYDAPIRTPRFACEYLRRIGVHPGTQVLVGRYDGDRQLLTHERDLFSRIIDGKKHYLSQSSFVIGKAFIQVFADPWRNSAPELEEDADEPLIALLPSHRRKLEWPPPVSIDDAGYTLVRSGGDDDDDSDASRPGARVGAQGDPAA